jgi:K+-transporting ATPase ATPase C chain
MSLDAVMKLIDDHTNGRTLGVLGESRVNVLALNMALDNLKP